jgi:uncharacterized protein YfkK (UPF0435 family)
MIQVTDHLQSKLKILNSNLMEGDHFMRSEIERLIVIRAMVDSSS